MYSKEIKLKFYIQAYLRMSRDFSSTRDIVEKGLMGELDRDQQKFLMSNRSLASPEDLADMDGMLGELSLKDMRMLKPADVS